VTAPPAPLPLVADEPRVGRTAPPPFGPPPSFVEVEALLPPALPPAVVRVETRLAARRFSSLPGPLVPRRTMGRSYVPDWNLPAGAGAGGGLGVVVPPLLMLVARREVGEVGIRAFDLPTTSPPPPRRFDTFEPSLGLVLPWDAPCAPLDILVRGVGVMTHPEAMCDVPPSSSTAKVRQREEAGRHILLFLHARAQINILEIFKMKISPSLRQIE